MSRAAKAVVCKCVVERVRKGLRGRQIRVGGGDRCGREAESIEAGLDMLGGAGRGGATGKDSGKVEAGQWSDEFLRKVAGERVG